MIDYNEEKRLSYITYDNYEGYSVEIENSFRINLITAIFSSVHRVNLGGRKCYLVKDGNYERFIDIETGIMIKGIDNLNNTTQDYYYEFGTVEDQDVEEPDTTGYTVY